ncbi:zinc finger protein 213-like isoform X2 [Nerophis lumbriciformis]|uniref:zinc finger protein 213-like isoform X2 n=1 Tax=Nerophis lumbriciformis TaxID=546530 RepID=UPI002ADF5786|nr:zinc finger and SCAN domain-containing protein 25-like isoform X2 [Nerophis lumbriciformis]
MLRMTEGEDPLVFLDLFEAMATACEWPETEWGVKLLPLLAGKAQRAAHSLPAEVRVHFPKLRRAILDRVGSHPEDHRRRFRAMRLGPEDRPIALAQQLQDVATRWLEPQLEESRMFERFVLEQFLDAIPSRMAVWVRYHRPRDLMAAVVLAEDHLAVHWQLKTPGKPTPAPRAGELPVPAPRRRLAQPEGATWTHEQGTGVAERGLPPQTAPRTPGPVCWGCGQPGHVRRDCSLMEVGQVMRVVGPPAPAPDPGEMYCVPADASGRGLGALLSQ